MKTNIQPKQLFLNHFRARPLRFPWAGLALWLGLFNLKTALRLTIAAFGLTTFNLSAATLYVSLESTNPVPPYADWTTAATNIQHAVDAAKAGDTVLVTNGVYSVGSTEVSVLDTNQEPPQLVSMGPSRVAVTNSIKLESVNGPLATTIDGGGSVRCVYLGSNAVLSGLTLTNGYSGRAGGGVFSEPSGVVTNCVLTGNWAYSGFECWREGSGGGAYGGTLYNCTLTANSALQGSGASRCTLFNCVLTNN